MYTVLLFVVIALIYSTHMCCTDKSVAKRLVFPFFTSLAYFAGQVVACGLGFLAPTVLVQLEPVQLSAMRGSLGKSSTYVMAVSEEDADDATYRLRLPNKDGIVKPVKIAQDIAVIHEEKQKVGEARMVTTVRRMDETSTISGWAIYGDDVIARQDIFVPLGAVIR